MFEAYLVENYEGIPVIPQATFFLDYRVPTTNTLYQIWVEIKTEEFIRFPGTTIFETEVTLHCIDYDNRAQLETVDDQIWFTVLDSNLENTTPPFGELGNKLGELALKINRIYSPVIADNNSSIHWSEYDQYEPEWLNEEWREANL